MKNNFPKVIKFESDERSLNYKYILPKQYFLNPSLKIMSIAMDKNYFDNNSLTIDGGEQPVEGGVYLKNPFVPNNYIPIEKATDDYFLDIKTSNYRMLAQRLGAKEIRFELISSQQEQMAVDVDGKISFKVVKGEVKSKFETEKKLEKKFRITNKFKIIEDFNLEQSILEINDEVENGKLFLDSYMKELIQNRNPKYKNLLTTHEIEIVLENEFNSLKEISAGLMHPVLEVSGSFKNTISTRNKTTLKLFFDF